MDVFHRSRQTLLIFRDQTLASQPEQVIFFVDNVVLNPVVKLDAEGSKFVQPAGIGVFWRFGQQLSDVPLQVTDLFMLMVKAGQQVGRQWPQFRIEDLFFLQKVDGARS